MSTITPESWYHEQGAKAPTLIWWSMCPTPCTIPTVVATLDRASLRRGPLGRQPSPALDLLANAPLALIRTAHIHLTASRGRYLPGLALSCVFVPRETS